MIKKEHDTSLHIQRQIKDQAQIKFSTLVSAISTTLVILLNGREPLRLVYTQSYSLLDASRYFRKLVPQSTGRGALLLNRYNRFISIGGVQPRECNPVTLDTLASEISIEGVQSLDTTASEIRIRGDVILNTTALEIRTTGRVHTFSVLDPQLPISEGGGALLL